MIQYKRRMKKLSFYLSINHPGIIHTKIFFSEISVCFYFNFNIFLLFLGCVIRQNTFSILAISLSQKKAISNFVFFSP